MWSYSGAAGRLRVFVDGTEAGKVWCNQTLVVPIDPGWHEVYVKQFYCKSRPVQVFVQQGMIVQLLVLPVSFLAAGLGSLFWPDNYFHIINSNTAPYSGSIPGA